MPMPTARRAAKKFFMHPGRQRLGTIAVSVAALFMTIGVASNPALAASARAAYPATSHVGTSAIKLPSLRLPSLKAAPSSGPQHRVGVVKLSAAQCDVISNSIQRTHPGAVPMRRCMIGVGIIARPVGHPAVHSNSSATASSAWQNFYAEAVACFGDTPVFGGPSNSASCEDEGWVGIQEWFAGNGSWMNLHSINPIFYASTKFGFTLTWKGVSGNNTTNMAVGDNWNYLSPLEGTGSMQLRIYNNYCSGGAYMCFTAKAWWQGP